MEMSKVLEIQFLTFSQNISRKFPQYGNGSIFPVQDIEGDLIEAEPFYIYHSIMQRTNTAGHRQNKLFPKCAHKRLLGLERKKTWRMKVHYLQSISIHHSPRKEVYLNCTLYSSIRSNFCFFKFLQDSIADDLRKHELFINTTP